MATTRRRIPAGVTVALAVVSLTAVGLALAAPSGAGAVARAGRGHRPDTAAPVDAGTDTLVCGTVSGTIRFTPALRASPAAGAVKVTLKLGVRGCTASAADPGGSPVSIASARATGVLRVTRASCTSLEDADATGGTVEFRFTTTPGSAPLSSGPTEVTFGSFSGTLLATRGSFTMGLPGAGAGLPAVQSSGSFVGPDGGRFATLSLTDESFVAAGGCGGRSGVKSLTIGAGLLDLG